ncbi:MAG: ubiquitin-like protein [Candidatus Hodarchaeota archaeon]
MSNSEEFEDFEDLEELEEEYEAPVKSKAPTAKIPSERKISLFFKTTVGPGESTEKMVVSKEAPVKDIKYTVGQVFGLRPEDFHLSHAGRTLDPNDTMGNYDVENGDEILLIPVSTAG